MMRYRTGLGYDVHRLEEGLPFFLGGIKIPHNKGAVGHSDADTLIHAICDALLGAAALGDIGRHFPDTDDAYKGIDSKILLKRVVELLKESGYAIENIDATVALQKPKIAPFIPEIRKCLAETACIEVDCISVKATTTEKLGFEGREEGVSVQAIALISRQY